MLELENKIDRFVTKLEMGMEFLADAGRVLVELLDEHPREYVFESIIKLHHWTTVDMLRTVESIGRKQLEPSALLLPRHVLNHVSALPIDEQVEALTKPVTVNNGGRHPYTKMAKDLTRSEAKEVFGQRRSGTDYAEVSEGWMEISMLNGKPFIKRVPRLHGIEVQKLTLKASGNCKFELVRLEKK